jgi:DNA polymerase III epsilon subunit family exonuclease
MRNSPLKDQSFVALDFETTGKYPLTSEICEVALIRFKGDEVIDRFQSFVKPLKGMTKESEAVHGLSLESLNDAPDLQSVLEKLVEFVGEDPLVGHNISFDLGFLIYELERLKVKNFKKLMRPHFCTSYLSINLWPKLSSHRLMHLASHIGLVIKPNHRAMQDAEVCMRVFQNLIEPLENFEELLKAQAVGLNLKDYSLENLLKEKEYFKFIVEACEKNLEFELKYSKGSKKNEWRPLIPKGLVLKEANLGFLVALDPGEKQTKRFLISKISDARPKA